MSDKMVSVSVAKEVRETPKARLFIYTHFENAAEFAFTWVPKSISRWDGSILEIPAWLKENIAINETRLAGRSIQFRGKQDYAYGTEETGFYTVGGFDVTDIVKAQ
jgi:hypothetical protein